MKYPGYMNDVRCKIFDVVRLPAGADRPGWTYSPVIKPVTNMSEFSRQPYN